MLHGCKSIAIIVPSISGSINLLPLFTPRRCTMSQAMPHAVSHYTLLVIMQSGVQLILLSGSPLRFQLLAD